MKVIERRVPVAEPDPVDYHPFGGWLKTVDGGLYHRRHEVVMGIDASPRNTAVFALSIENYSSFGYVLALPMPSKGGPEGVRRLLMIERYLRIVLGNIKNQTAAVHHIVMEQYAFGSIQGQALGEVGGLTKMTLCHVFGSENIVAYPTFPTGNQLKLFATSNGKADKNVVLKDVYRKWGVDLDDDNLADAYTAARWAAAIVTGTTAHEYEAQVVARVQEHAEWEHREPPQKRRSASPGTRRRS